MTEFEHRLKLSCQQFRQCYQSRNTTMSSRAATTTFTRKDFTFHCDSYDGTEYLRLNMPQYEAEDNFSVTNLLNKCNAIKIEANKFPIKVSSNTKDVIKHRLSGVRVMRYEDYCKFRAWRKALNTGMILETCKAKALFLLTDSKTKVFFTRTFSLIEQLMNTHYSLYEIRKSK